MLRYFCPEPNCGSHLKHKSGLTVHIRSHTWAPRQCDVSGYNRAMALSSSTTLKDRKSERHDFQSRRCPTPNCYREVEHLERHHNLLEMRHLSSHSKQ